jgi:hypothetical protein
MIDKSSNKAAGEGGSLKVPAHHGLKEISEIGSGPQISGSIEIVFVSPQDKELGPTVRRPASFTIGQPRGRAGRHGRHRRWAARELGHSSDMCVKVHVKTVGME